MDVWEEEMHSLIVLRFLMPLWKTAKKRLEILNKSNHGFFIASEDLKLLVDTGRFFRYPAEWRSGICAGGYLPGCGGAAGGFGRSKNNS